MICFGDWMNTEIGCDICNSLMPHVSPGRAEGERSDKKNRSRELDLHFEGLYVFFDGDKNCYFATEEDGGKAKRSYIDEEA
jgi:hypothetical protein